MDPARRRAGLARRRRRGRYLPVAAGAVPGRPVPTDADAVRTLVGTLVGETLPFITIVLAIIQLVLTQELDWPEGLRSRYGGAEQFQFLVELTADRAAALPDSLDGGDAEMEGADLERAVQRYAESVQSESERVAEALEGTDFGTFDALSAVLGHHHGQHELAALSRLLLYVGFPTLFGGGVLLSTYPLIADGASDPAVLFVVAGGIALVFLPLAVLLSYTLRIATIAARTGDFGPFVPRLEVEG